MTPVFVATLGKPLWWRTFFCCFSTFSSNEQALCSRPVSGCNPACSFLSGPCSTLPLGSGLKTSFSQKPVLMTQQPWRVFQQAGGSAPQGAPWEVALRWRTWSLRRTSVFSSGLQLSPPARCLTSVPALSVCNGKYLYPMKSKCQRGGELCKVLNDWHIWNFFLGTLIFKCWISFLASF